MSQAAQLNTLSRITFASAGAVRRQPTVADLTAYADARDLAVKFGAKVAPFHFATGCWIYRISWLQSAAGRGAEQLQAAIAEANRYA